MLEPINRAKLLNALSAYDRKQATKKGYNPYALSHYMAALTEAADSPLPMRQALVQNFCGRLLDVCLKAVGEPTSTLDEQKQRRY